jgi:hypothetical protein
VIPSLRRRALCLLVVFGAAGGSVTSRTDPGHRLDLTGPDIFHLVEQANRNREAALQSYVSTRQYTVLEPGQSPDADLVVSMQYVAPFTKTFGQASETGVGWIHKRVFNGLMRAEQEAAAGEQKTRSAITSANYSAELLGSEQRLGRDCYVLKLQPKRDDRYLITGRVWIEKEEFAIVRLEGDPVRSPSFWVEHPHLVREYQRIGRFWLPQRDETTCHVRFVGDYLLRIRYYDYKVTPAP